MWHIWPPHAPKTVALMATACTTNCLLQGERSCMSGARRRDPTPSQIDNSHVKSINKAAPAVVHRSCLSSLVVQHQRNHMSPIFPSTPEHSLFYFGTRRTDLILLPSFLLSSARCCIGPVTPLLWCLGFCSRSSSPSSHQSMKSM